MKNSWLAHHGILGQKWGVRRFQNKDGSLTSAGQKRYDKNSEAAKSRSNAEFKRRLEERNAKREEEYQRKQEQKEIDKEAKDRNRELDRNRTRMSDKDLDEAINRLKKEKQLHELSNEGSAFRKTVMTEIGKKVLITAGAGAALYGAKVFVEKALKDPQFADAVFRGGAKKK